MLIRVTDGWSNWHVVIVREAPCLVVWDDGDVM
jgi:hypothetical protein